MKNFNLSAHALDIQQQEVPIHVAKIETCIQSMLMDNRLPAGSIFLNPSGMKREYTDQHGQHLYGFEPFHGTF